MCSLGSGAFEGRQGNADSAVELVGAGTGGEGEHLHWDPSQYLRQGTVAAVRLAGECGGVGSTRSLIAVDED